MIKAFFFLWLCCYSSLLLKAQVEPLRNFSVKDGLPSGIVYDCLQDKQGFMWFATAAGLARFDGINFKVFTTEDGLTNNEILQIALDKDGSIWIFPFGTTPCIYDPVSKKLYNEGNYPELKKLKNLKPQFQVRSSSAGLVGYAWRNAFFFENKKITKLDESDLGDLWPINKDSLLLFSIQRKASLVSHGKTFHLNFLIQNTGVVFSRSPDWGRWKIFINSPMTQLTLSEYTHDGSVKPRANFSNDHPINNVNKYADKIYLATTNGAHITDTLLTPLEYVFPEKNISKVFVDKNHNEWFCSLSGEGVYMRLKNGVKQYDTRSGLPNDNISILKEAPNNLLLCGDDKGNFYSMDPAGQTIQPFILTKLSEAIRGICLVGKSYIVYSSHNLLVNRKIIDIKDTINGSAKSIKSVLPDTNGNLLIGSHIDLTVYNPSTGKSDYITFGLRFVTLCYLQGNLYYGNDKGVFRIKNLYPFQEAPVTDTAAILSKPINHLLSTKDGILWVATNNDGVIALKNERIIGHFTASSEQPLASNICKKIYFDEENQSIWVATNKGISRISYRFSNAKINAIITTIASSEGLNDDDVNDICVRNGKVYAATIKGLCVFPVNLSRKEMPVAITDMAIKNYSAPDSIVFPQRVYNLNHGQNNISISYTGICYTCNKSLNFQYRLLGVADDTAWQNTTANRVEFLRLASGDYRFQVRTDAAHMQEIRFIIRPAFWQTGWFYILLIAALGGIFFFTIRTIARRIRKREFEKTTINKKFAELEFQALQAQMNPHFVFNAMNTLQNYILKNESENASEYLANFARLMRLFLEASRNKFIDLGNEIELLEKYIRLEQARLQYEFTYKIEVEPGVELDRQIPSVIIQPFVENAILHGLRHRTDNNGLLSLSFGLNDSYLRCIITDNGIGRTEAEKLNRAKATQHKSQGINIIDEKIKTLTEMNSIDISISINDNFAGDGQSAGTTVIIDFKNSN